MTFPCSPRWWSSARAASAVCRWRARGRGPATWRPASSWSRHRSWAVRTRRRRSRRRYDAGGGRRGEERGGLRRPSRRRLPAPRPRRPRRGCREAAARSGVRAATAWRSSSRSAPTTLSWRASSSRRCGSTRRIPAYRRAAASRAEGYHIALASALALASLAVEPAKEHAFVTAFLASWGAAARPPQARAAAVGFGREVDMCRSIKTLHNFAPPATDDEIRASVAAVRPKAERLHEALQGKRGRIRSRRGPGGACGTRATRLSRHEGPDARSRR